MLDHRSPTSRCPTFCVQSSPTKIPPNVLVETNQLFILEWKIAMLAQRTVIQLKWMEHKGGFNWTKSGIFFAQITSPNLTDFPVNYARNFVWFYFAFNIFSTRIHRRQCPSGEFKIVSFWFMLSWRRWRAVWRRRRGEALPLGSG